MIFMESERLLSAIKFATEKHGKQKYGIHPFIFHPVEVAIKLTALIDKQVISLDEIPFHNIDTLLVSAILHDVLEDTDTIGKEISDNFGYSVLKNVIQVTHKKDYDPEEYYRRMEVAALMIKTADRLVNIGNMDKTHMSNPHFRDKVFPMYKREMKYFGKYSGIIAQAILTKEEELNAIK